MDRYLREETNIDGDDESKQMILRASISSIKRNTHKMSTFINNEEFNKKKVIFIIGAIGTGKSCLSVDVATHFGGEIINSDKIQVYKGLEIVTNKITHAEKQGLVDEVRQIFIPDADYTKGIRRSIGVPEMDRYLREETNIYGDDESKQMILQASISSIKRNTRMLICNQLDKIQRLISEKMWSVHHIIATDVFKEDREEDIDEAWRNTVFQPCLDIVKRFLKSDHDNIIIEYKMCTFINNEEFNKKKVIFIMGATRTGKSRLSIDVATHFGGEIINSDKMQVYKGLEIVTNKITHVLNRRVDMRDDQMVKAGLVDEVRQIFIPDADFTKGI
nr:adenylate isopentenyltransferase 7, mitochondrial-like [Solanum lycopersicum]